MNSRHRLLMLAEQVSRVDADLGSATSQAWFTAAIDSLAHALVDLSDGARRPTVTLAVPAAVYPGDPPAHDRASCAAARAELIAVDAGLKEVWPTPEPPVSDLREHAAQCLEFLISALGEASAPHEHNHNGSPATAHRSLRSAFRVLQPPAI